VVDEHAVDLLRHGPVEGPHPGLHVRHRDAGLRGDDPAREGRVGVAVDQHQPGRDLGDDRLQHGEHARRLRGVGAGVDTQLAVRSRDVELVHEHARELVVVMLAGVDEHLLVLDAQTMRDGSGLDELGAVADDG